MDHVARALELNQGGYNCAQSVLCAFSDLTGLEEKTALAIAAGLGGGLRSGEVCGAVSGAVLVLGALFPFDDSTDYDASALPTWPGSSAPDSGKSTGYSPAVSFWSAPPAWKSATVSVPVMWRTAPGCWRI